MIWWAGSFSVSLTEKVVSRVRRIRFENATKCVICSISVFSLRRLCLVVFSHSASHFFLNAANLLSFDECLLRLLWFCVFLRYIILIYLIYLYKETCSECLQPRGYNPRIASRLATWQYQNMVGTQGCVFNLQGGAWQNKFVLSILELSLSDNMRVIR